MGEPGRKAVKHLLPKLIQSEKIDFVIANGENVAGGFGLTEDSCKELFEAGVDVITGGNHSWDKKDIVTYMAVEPRVLASRELCRRTRRGALPRHVEKGRESRRGQRDGPGLHVSAWKIPSRWRWNW